MMCTVSMMCTASETERRRVRATNRRLPLPPLELPPVGTAGKAVAVLLTLLLTAGCSIAPRKAALTLAQARTGFTTRLVEHVHRSGPVDIRRPDPFGWCTIRRQSGRCRPI